jgi:hypothetical protein
MDRVVLLIDFGETWTVSPEMPRYVAEHVCADFAHGVPWEGKHPTQALIVPCLEPTSVSSSQPS